MKLPRRRHLWTILMYTAITLVCLAWVGTYLHWRKSSLMINSLSAKSMRMIIVPVKVSEQTLKIFAPLAQIDGWIHGEDVLMLPPSPPSIGHGGGLNELPAGKNASSE